MSKAAKPAVVIASSPTPGPWYAMTGDNGGISDQATVFSEYETDGYPTFIADTRGVDDDMPIEQRKANALLIAAAPELLELARLFAKGAEYEIRKSQREGDDEGARLKTVTLNLIRAGIAKAERGVR